ncbi:hypothetical protein HYE67_009646 [Fusarium culmorum]|uniref:Rhodopsin domain-containing protein n=1 Tax=Fusarium culmorum TaxID=5516 RepID=A0A7S8DF52_FUSCU|nr:hypothetical protein HYE67_009646 [Fusarium culmorum]
MLFTREHETPFNKSPVVRAVSMILMVVTVFSVFIRLLTRLAAVKRLKYSTFFTSDEIMILTSMIFSIAQSTIVYTQSSNGLGKLDVSSSQVSSILKAQLGSDVLFFITLGLSKLSATSTIWTMSPLSNKTILPIQILIGGWAISAVLVRSFACSLPNPWDYLNGRCINMVAFWIYADAVNIGTDLLITALTLGILVHLQMPVGRKAMVIGVFGCRIVYARLTPICAMLTTQNNPPDDISHILLQARVKLNNTHIRNVDANNHQSSSSMPRHHDNLHPFLVAISQEYELDGLGSGKHARPTVEDVSQLSDQDHMDSAQLNMLGKKSVLKRNFGGWTILGFSCAVLVTWEGTLMNFAPGLTNGGSAGIIYGFIFVWIGVLSSFATLCELVSIAPMAAGQYHWVAMLAPPRYSKYLSYITGWMNFAGWQGTSAAAGFLTATMIQGLVIFTRPDYDAQTWHGTLLIWACILVAIIINTVVSALLPILEGMILILHLIGFFAILITLLVFRDNDNDNGTEVFTEWRNGGEWPTQGLSWFVGLLGCVFSFTGVDCSFHMCEEVRNPSLVVPRSIMGSITINGLLGFGMIIAMLYSATDIDAAVDSPTGYPFMEIFYQATGSINGTAGMASLIVLMTLSATVGVIASTSRMLWAFARDNAMPFSGTLSKVEPRTNMPVWSISITCLISCLIGLINLGSSVVYNAIISVAISGLYASYFVPAILLLYRRCDKDYKIRNITGDGQVLEWGPWHLKGMFGIANNVFALDAASMNYAPLMTGGVAILATIYYFLFANKVYVGPKVEI